MVLRHPGVRAGSRLRIPVLRRRRKRQVSPPLQDHGGDSQQETRLHLAVRRVRRRLAGDLRALRRREQGETQADARRPRDFPEAACVRKDEFRGGLDRNRRHFAQEFRRRQARGGDDPRARLRRAARAHVEAVDRAGAHRQMVGPERLHVARLRDGLPPRRHVPLRDARARRPSSPRSWTSSPATSSSPP